MLWWTLRQLKSNNKSKRRKAIGKLGESKDVRAFEHLISALADSDSWARAVAVQTLGQTGDVRAFEHLISALADSDSSVRAVAVQTLGQTGDARATEHLVKLLEDVYFRCATAKALSQISTEVGDKQFYTLIATLFIDSVGDLGKTRQRITAIEELGATGDTRAVEPLVTAITDVDKDVQTAAIEALVKIGNERAVEPLKELYRRKGLWKLRNGAEPDPTTESIELRAQTVGKAAAAAIKKFDPDWSEPIVVPQFVIIFRGGADQPPAPEQYCQDVAKSALGKELTFRGWRIAGTPHSISEYEARSIYHSATGILCGRRVSRRQRN